LEKIVLSIEEEDLSRFGFAELESLSANPMFGCTGVGVDGVKEAEEVEGVEDDIHLGLVSLDLDRPVVGS
jgi:hypothetical protein